MERVAQGGKPLRLRCSAAVLLFSLLVGLSAAANGLERALAGSDLTAEERQRIRELVEEAEADGIPAELVLPRVEEGVAKNVPIARLLRGVRRNVDLFREARDLLDELPAGRLLIRDPADWRRTANLLASGISPAEIRQILAAVASRPADYRNATSAHVRLRNSGIGRREALAVVEALLRSDIPGSRFDDVVALLEEVDDPAHDVLLDGAVLERLGKARNIPQVQAIVRHAQSQSEKNAARAAAGGGGGREGEDSSDGFSPGNGRGSEHQREKEDKDKDKDKDKQDKEKEEKAKEDKEESN